MMIGMAFKKVHYTVSNSLPKLVVKKYVSSIAAQHSRIFKYFQGPWISQTEFEHFQEFFKHCMNPVNTQTLVESCSTVSRFCQYWLHRNSWMFDNLLIVCTHLYKATCYASVVAE